MVGRSFGTPLNPSVPREPTAYKNKVPRGEEPCGPHTGFDCSGEYCNTYARDEHNSEFERKTWSPDPKKGSHWELVDGNGNGFIRGPDSSKLTFINGTDNKHGKNGGIRTYNSNMDSASYGGRRVITGNDGNQKHLSGRAPGGATYWEDAGFTAKYATFHTDATTGSSGKTSHNIGKQTINAEGGIGFGVNKGSSMRIFQRMEPDGTYHLQVTPKGQEGGAAVIKINPDGTILITSVKTLTIETKDDITINSGKKVSITGQSGIILKSKGHIITNGKTTKIQKGGPKEPPRTFV